jgi:hypothetical protein
MWVPNIKNKWKEIEKGFHMRRNFPGYVLSMGKSLTFKLHQKAGCMFLTVKLP